MASLSELFAVAQAQRQEQEAADPLFSGAQALTGGLAQGIAQRQAEAQQRRQREQIFQMLGLNRQEGEGVKTNAGKQSELVNDPRQDFKVEPSFDAISGQASMMIRPKTPEEQFNEAAGLYTSGAISEQDLRRVAPTFQAEIDEIVHKSGVSGSQMPRMSEGRVIQGGNRAIRRTGGRRIQRPESRTIRREEDPQPGDIVPTKFDALGRPEGFERVKKSAAQEKRDVSNQEMMNQTSVMIDLFNEARQEVDEIPNLGSSGIKGRVAGSFANLKAMIGESPTLKVFRDNVGKFATLEAKAAGEQRPTDQDIERFVAPLLSIGGSDEENAKKMEVILKQIKGKGQTVDWARPLVEQFEQTTGKNIDFDFGGGESVTETGVQFTYERVE